MKEAAVKQWPFFLSFLNWDKLMYKILFLGIIFCLSHTVHSQSDKQYVILISLDGYRYDYTERFEPKNIVNLIAEGVEASALIPSFPTKTFPNHYTIATGLKPENHGLVNNTIYDSKMDAVYSIGDREAVENPEWYGGTPIWVLAEQNRLITASYFFVGTEAPIQGIHPSYYYNYDAAVPNLARISKVFDWLSLPEEERPRLITLYFSDMDDVGHVYGPNNDEKLAVRLKKLDAELGALFEGISSFDLNINIIIVSDHGMTDVKPENLINLDSILQDLPLKVVNNGALAHVNLEDKSRKGEILKNLNSKALNYKVVDVEDKTAYQDIESYRQRLGDLLILPELGHYLVTTGGIVNYQKRATLFKTDVFGEHGYDPEYEDMHGIFYAHGPAFKKGYKVNTVNNTDIFPLICQILELPIPSEIDGDLGRIEEVLNRGQR